MAEADVKVGWCEGDDKRPSDAEVKVWVAYRAITVPGESEEDRRESAARWAKTARRAHPLITRHLRDDLRFHRRHGFLPHEARTPEECRLRDQWQDGKMETPPVRAALR